MLNASFVYMQFKLFLRNKGSALFLHYCIFFLNYIHYSHITISSSFIVHPYILLRIFFLSTNTPSDTHTHANDYVIKSYKT